MAFTITTDAATVVIGTKATLNSTINNFDGQPFAGMWFQYGETVSYGTNTPPVIVVDPDTTHAANITGLDSKTLYHFRAVGNNTVDIVYGADRTFTTTDNYGYIWIDGTNLHWIDVDGDDTSNPGTKSGATGQTAGYIWVESTALHWIDADGDEHYIEGLREEIASYTPGYLWVDEYVLFYIDADGDMRFI